MAQESANRKLTAFLADSDKLARDELAEALEESGFFCESTGDLNEAQARLMGDGDYHVIFIDLHLHTGQGHHLIYKLLQRDDPPIIYFTAPDVELKLGRMLLDLGVEQIFYKPLDLADVVKIATGSALTRRAQSAFRQDRVRSTGVESQLQTSADVDSDR